MREFLIFQPISQTVTVILKGDVVKVERYENKSLNFCLPLFMPRIEQLYPYFSHPPFSLAPKDRRTLLYESCPRTDATASNFLPSCSKHGKHRARLRLNTKPCLRNLHLVQVRERQRLESRQHVSSITPGPSGSCPDQTYSGCHTTLPANLRSLHSWFHCFIPRMSDHIFYICFRSKVSFSVTCLAIMLTSF